MTTIALPGGGASTLDASPSPFADLAVHSDAGAVDAAWGELEACAPASIYQTRRFLVPWSATLGAHRRLRPLYVLARDAAGRPAALLPLALRSRGRIVVAGWLGGRDSNLPMALVRHPGEWGLVEVRRLLRAAARKGGIDVFDLSNQPLSFAGMPNPFAALPGAATSASAAYATTLPVEAERLFAAKLSKEARKKLRKKEAKLAALGEVRHLVATTAAERAAVIDALLALKAARLRARGISSDFEAPAMRSFIAAAAAGGAVELHALLVGERIVAAYGGGVHGGQWSAMINAFDPDEEIARTSPGELLLMRLAEHCCARGIGRFDLGIGEARYKTALCDEPITLVDAVVPVTPVGLAAAVALRTRHAAKRRLKRDPRLHAMAARLARLARPLG